MRISREFGRYELCLRSYGYVQMQFRFCLLHDAANVRAAQVLYQNDVHCSFLATWKLEAASKLRGCARLVQLWWVLNLALPCSCAPGCRQSCSYQAMQWYTAVNVTRYKLFGPLSHATSSSHDMMCAVCCVNQEKIKSDTATSSIAGTK
jgi:hypothetical protein